ncbi:MAG: hypothetical protein H5T96_09330 [Tissierellales bacterium]|nr:hypothetical protein [Tissierellales bacterium]
MERYKKWEKSCLAKKKLSEETANAIIKKSKVKLYKYYCRYCFGWHLTKRKTNITVE